MLMGNLMFLKEVKHNTTYYKKDICLLFDNTTLFWKLFIQPVEPGIRTAEFDSQTERRTFIVYETHFTVNYNYYSV